LDTDRTTCRVCPHSCSIAPGTPGRCRGRINREGRIVPVNYGIITSLALDPIEKKPLNRFYPGSRILSAGSFGCNLNCPFCQNHEIAAAGESDFRRLYEVSPKELCSLAKSETVRGNIGVAYTYNEALAGYEYVRDSAYLVHEAGMLNVLVTNGMAELPVLEELLPYIDAMNIDLKGFTDRYYSKILGGDRAMVMHFIEHAAENCHVELTTLIIPDENDSENEMRELSSWVASLSPEIPLHISRFFPRFHMTDRDATDVSLIYRLADVAREKLKYVYTGNC
jgi:pyruvate formate lyase activating enzyme